MEKSCDPNIRVSRFFITKRIIMLREPARERKCAASKLSLENCRLPVDLSFRGLSNRILGGIRDRYFSKNQTEIYTYPLRKLLRYLYHMGRSYIICQRKRLLSSFPSSFPNFDISIREPKKAVRMSPANPMTQLDDHKKKRKVH